MAIGQPLYQQKNVEDFFDFPENILEIKNLPPIQDFANNPIFYDIYNNVHLYNSNQIILFNGLPRTGKSEACIDFGYNLDRDPQTGDYRFGINKMAYTLKDYMKLIKNNNEVGACLQWEEAGLAEYGANAREFFSKDNKDASTIFQSMGFKKQINLVNLPMKSMLDKQIRSLVHWIVTTERISSGYCFAKMYKTRLIAIKDEVVTPRYRFIDPYGVIKKVSWIKIPRAPRNLRTEYKHISDAFKNDVQEHITVRQDDWKRLSYIDSDKEVDKRKMYDYLKEHMQDFFDVKVCKIDLNSFVVKENLPDEFIRKVKPVISLFNTELKNERIKPNAKTLEEIAAFNARAQTRRDELRKVNSSVKEEKRGRPKRQNKYELLDEEPEEQEV